MAKEKLISETIEFTAREFERITKVAKAENITVDFLIQEATREFLQNMDPKLEGWKIPRSLFELITIPEPIRRRLEMWKRCRERINVDVCADGLVLLNEKGLEEFSKKNRFVLLKLPSQDENNLSHDERFSPTSPTENSRKEGT